MHQQSIHHLVISSQVNRALHLSDVSIASVDKSFVLTKFTTPMEIWTQTHFDSDEIYYRIWKWRRRQMEILGSGVAKLNLCDGRQMIRSRLIEFQSVCSRKLHSESSSSVDMVHRKRWINYRFNFSENWRLSSARIVPWRKLGRICQLNHWQLPLPRGRYFAVVTYFCEWNGRLYWSSGILNNAFQS